ncbi:unnamed protein product [Musa banksii]
MLCCFGVNKKAPTVAYRQRMMLSRKYQFFSLGSSGERARLAFTTTTSSAGSRKSY